jgi:hypothetical protein
MPRKQINAQGEMQLVAEWAATLPTAWQSKTRVNVGAQPLQYAGVPLTPKQQMAFGVWNDWADLRVATPAEVWIVEGKLVATGGAYGQVLDYVNQYPSSADYAQFAPRPIVPVVLTMGARARTSAMFAKLGVRTIIFQPSFSFSLALQKLFPAAQILIPEPISPLGVIE